MGSYLYLIPLLPLLGAAINLLTTAAIGRSPPRWYVNVLAVGSVATSFCIVLGYVLGPLWTAWTAAGGAEAGTNPAIVQNVYTWIQAGDFRADLAFQLDALSAVMCLVVTFVGALIHIYSTGYMHDEPRYSTYFGYLNLFTGAMLMLVLGDNLLVMFIGWEGVGLCSYLLIGFWFTEEANAYAGRKAFVVNRIGDFGFLLGIFLIFWVAGTVNFGEINANAALFVESSKMGERVAFFACLLLFIGACGKSAQIPLYVWLPDAMAGPTPVSALIHAATMVTAGVYMVARLSFLFSTSTTAMAVVSGVGAATALVAAIIAFAQNDLKKVLAYSTVSQLGFMFVGVGTGAYVAGIFHLVTHAFFKAGLFLSAGSISHATGTLDIRKLGGLRKLMRWTHGCFVVYWLAICGIFPFAGFFSKDEILLGAFAAHQDGWWAGYGTLLWAVMSLAALGTAFYMSRLYFLTFWGDCRLDDESKKHLHESPWSMVGPLVVLAAFTCVIGFIGLPHLGRLPTLLPHWLAPAIFEQAMGHASAGTMVGLMGVALALGVAGIAAAYSLYSRGPSASVERLTESGAGAGLYRVVLNKLYWDEAYDWLVVRPFRAISDALFRFIDRVVIDDLLVGGWAIAVDVAGRSARWVQNGQVQRYLVFMLVGGAAIVFLATRADVDFSTRPAGDSSVVFRVETNNGPGSKGAQFEWDFQSDGEIDATQPEVRWRFAAPGTYRVTLRATDGAFGKAGSITKQVKVEAGAAGGAE
jgi:NADH-quinone oxidoreductase subunit L